MRSLVEIVLWIFRRRFLNFVNVFLLFCQHLPLENDMALYLNTFIHFSQRYFLPSLVEIRREDLEQKIFKFRYYIFGYFVIVSPLKRVYSFI